MTIFVPFTSVLAKCTPNTIQHVLSYHIRLKSTPNGKHSTTCSVLSNHISLIHMSCPMVGPNGSVVVLKIVCVCRRNTRMNTSLPVSPTSSPLRQYGSPYKSCYVSPPHPSYTTIRQNNSNYNNFNDILAVQSRPNAKTTWYETQTPQPKPQTPTRSPRSRLI